MTNESVSEIKKANQNEIMSVDEWKNELRFSLMSSYSIGSLNGYVSHREVVKSFVTLIEHEKRKESPFANPDVSAEMYESRTRLANKIAHKAEEWVSMRIAVLDSSIGKNKNRTLFEFETIQAMRDADTFEDMIAILSESLNGSRLSYAGE